MFSIVATAVSVAIVCCSIYARLTYQYDSVCRPVPCGAADAGTAGGPLDTIRSCHIMPTHAHRTLQNTDYLVGFDEKPAEKPAEKCSVSVSFLLRCKPTEIDRIFGGKPKNRPNHYSLSIHNTVCELPGH